ncbi:conjugal transfer protein TraJ [Arcobacter sp. FW59]|nr:conjugal transfer protein TraJ [Arcobacter sp. FW59]
MKKDEKILTDDNYDEKSAWDYDVARSYIIDKSNKRAWRITYISLTLTVMLGIAIMLLTPLKTVELLVVKVDKNGFIDIVTQLDEQVITTDEAIDKSFIYRYVKSKEQYYFETLNQDFETVQMLSSPNVQNKYIKEMTDKENGKANILKDKVAIETKILSIVLTNKSDEKIATVRIETVKKARNNEKEIEKEIKVVTLTYDYLPIKQNASLKLENPLGFVVTSYRVDEEIKE